MQACRRAIDSGRRGLHTWQIGAAVGIGGVAAFANAMYFGQKQSIRKLIASSVKALREEVTGSDINLRSEAQHWDLIRHCLKKKGYSAKMLADVGGIDLVMDHLDAGIVSSKSEDKNDDDTSVARDRVRFAVGVVPYIVLNSNDEMLKSFAEREGVQRLRSIAMGDTFALQEKLRAMQSMWELYKKNKEDTVVKSSLIPGSASLMEVANSKRDDPLDATSFAVATVRNLIQSDPAFADDAVSSGSVDVMLHVLRDQRPGDELRSKLGDTLGLLSSKSEDAKARIEASDMSGVVESLSWRY